MNLQFPKDFIWGVSTSAYQIEGAHNKDGRGESVWDRFSHTPGTTLNGDTGDIAADHYHRWRDDVALMKSLGLKAYRFSVAWPRILPQGRGAVNQAGLDFYSSLVDALLEADIQPFLTLYHWDLPQALEDEGGWPVRSTADAFAEYAEVVARALGDRVKHWITHNEPWCSAFLGYEQGVHAPGFKNEWPNALRTAHHVLLSHGWAVQAIRAHSPGAEVGAALNHEPAEPASVSGTDYQAARRYNGYYSRWFLDPIYGRHYPADMVAWYTDQGHLPNGLDYVQPGDMDIIATDTDFLGVNYYTRVISRDDDAPENAPVTNLRGDVITEMDWEVYPEGLYKLLNRLYFDYQPRKLYVTENGASYSDGPDETGSIADERRIAYLREHIAAVQRAIESGVPVEGYFVWSLLDNFEWSKGYSQRFGLVWVDYETQARLPKDSALWYRDLIANNGL